MDKRVLIIADDVVVNVDMAPDLGNVVVALGQTTEIDEIGIDRGFVRQPGGGFAPPPQPPMSQAELTAYAADVRWQREVGGIIVAGVSIATDDRSKLMITGSRVAAAANPAWTTMWEGIHLIDAATMILISDAVEAHVNGVWSTFATVKAGIETGAITTRPEIDAAFGNGA